MGLKLVFKYLIKMVGISMPWAVIACLLYVGLFVQPKPVGSTVTPAAIELRDRFYGVEVIEDKLIWIVGADGKIIKSSDFGETWIVQEVPVDFHLQDISAWDNNRAVVVGNEGVILTTNNGGVTWENVQVPLNEVTNKLLNVETFKNGEAWAVGAFGMILKTNDYGQNWNLMNKPEDFIINGITKVNDDTYLAVGEFGIILKTSNNGEDWYLVDSGIETSLTSVDFNEKGEGIAVGLEGIILLSKDYGDTWVQLNNIPSLENYKTYPSIAKKDTWEDITTEHLFEIKWIEDKNLWISTGAKGVWITASEDFSNWQSGRLSPKEMGWYTSVNIINDSFIFVGQNIGFWYANDWRLLSLK